MQMFFPFSRQRSSSRRQQRRQQRRQTGPFLSAIILLLPLFSAACFTSRDLAPTDVRPGSGVRISLNPEGARSAGDFTGAPALDLSGTALGWTADTLQLEVWRTDLPQGRTFQPGRIVVPLHLTGIDRITERSLSPIRTVTTSVGGAVLLYQFYRWMWGETGVRGEVPTPPLVIEPRVFPPALRF